MGGGSIQLPPAAPSASLGAGDVPSESAYGISALAPSSGETNRSSFALLLGGSADNLDEDERLRPYATCVTSCTLPAPLRRAHSAARDHAKQHEVARVHLIMLPLQTGVPGVAQEIPMDLGGSSATRVSFVRVHRKAKQ